MLDAAGVPVAQAATEPQQGGTDTWVALPGTRAAQPAGPEDNRPQDAKLLSLNKQLRETQELLATRGDAVLARVKRDFESGIRAGVVTTPTLLTADGRLVATPIDRSLRSRAGT